MNTNESPDVRGLEKPELRISFIPIICSAPLIYAHSHGFFEKNGLTVRLTRAPGWSGIKELMVHGLVDAVHMLSPMPLACSLGIDGKKAPIRLAAIQNVNGQALTLAKRHLGIRDVRDMKGFVFGVPYRFSMHYYLLCYFLAENGINPLKDVTIREVAPPRMPYYLEKGWVDGVLAPDPFNQIPVHRGVGFIYVLSKDIWAGHPCCCFATSQDLIDGCPQTYRAMLRSVLEAELALHKADVQERKAIAREISGPEYLNQEDPVPVEQALSGDFPDGRGEHRTIPDRIDFIPYPWEEYGSWILSQMQRWAQLPGRVDYREVVESVFQGDTREFAEALGFEGVDKPRLEGIDSFAGKDAFSYMQGQPFCAFQDRPTPRKDYALSEPARQRLSGIIRQMAQVAGGDLDSTVEITGADEIGLLEQILAETILNMKFGREALAEHADKLEERVRARTGELVTEVAERKRAEERAQHLNALLRAVRNVNQLIAREKDRDRLLQGTCDSLSEARGYRSTWIALLDESCRLTTAAEAGLGKDFEPLVDQMKRGELIECAKRALLQPRVLAVDDPLSTCGDCPLAQKYGDQKAMIARLEYRGNVYGVMVASVRGDLTVDEEERGLLEEVAGDIGFALHSIRLEEDRKRAEAALRLEQARLEALLQLSQMTEAPMQETTDFALEEAVRLTESEIGYLAFMSDDETVLTMHSWSKTAMERCAIIDKPIVYPVETTGLWGEAVRQRKPVITNDYSAPNPLKKGYPAGHVEVIRHMNVPVFDGERIVAVAGVGNKGEPYDESDVRELTLLMQGMWRLLQRRQAEESLRASETQLRQIIDLVPHMIFAKDREGRFLLVNRAMADAYGMPVEQLTGRRQTGLHPDQDELRRMLEDDRTVIESGQRLTIPQQSFTDAAGKRRFLQAIKIPYTVPGVSERAVLGVAVDITPLKQAEDELRKAHDELEQRVQRRTAQLASANEGLTREIAERKRAEEDLAYERFLLNTLMENSPDYIYFKDAESRFIRISKALAGYFGLRDPSEAIGKSDFDIFDPKRAEQYLADEQEVMTTGKPVVGKEEEQPWPDGRVTWVSTSKVPLRSPEGAVIGTFGISRDITGRKRAEAQLQAAKEAAEAASRAKSDFLANMSHEVRTPMNAIIGMTELVLDTDLTPSQREYLNMVRESGESLLSVINDVLDFSKIEAGKLDLEHAAFDLRESLGDTMKSLGLRAHTKGLELACRIQPEVPDRLVGDMGRIRQIVVNLVGNAIKFTEAGEVVLAVDRQSQSDSEVVLHFAVTDTGLGIPEDKRTAIFEAFEQVDASSTRRYGGTGLGLAISSRLVQLMNGKIWVESEVGRGSTFHFTARFGLARDEVTDISRARPAMICDTPVLVVDDNATNRRILEEMLRNWGMKPSAAAGASEALPLLRRAYHAGQPFALVLTDANMPDVDGFALAEQIKQDPELSSTVIMMLTSGDRPGDVARCEQAGVAAYLLKPIKQSELFDALVLVLGVAAPEDEVPGAAVAEKPSRVRPLRVLLAEDSLVNQKLAVGLLEKHGHTVVVANHGREAIAALESQHFDLILMDVQMPEMDGFEATAVIRTKEKRTGAHIPIIAMTAHAMKGDRERCLEAGMDGYVAKPIRARQVFETIESILGTPPEGRTQPEPAPSESRTLDWSEALRGVQEDHALLKTVVEAILDEAPRLLTAIRQAITASDAAALRRAAHTLKGSIRHFGETDAFELACRLEMMGEEGNLGSAEETLAALEREMKWVGQALSEYVQRNGTADDS